MAVGDAYVFPGFLTPVLTKLFFPKPPTTFLKCFCRGERQTYARKKSHLNRGSNSQPPGHDSDTFTTEPPGNSQHKPRQKHECMHIQGSAFVVIRSDSLQAGVTKMMHNSNDGGELKQILHTMIFFETLRNNPFENIVEKGKIMVTSI